MHFMFTVNTVPLVNLSKRKGKNSMFVTDHKGQYSLLNDQSYKGEKITED